MVQNYHLVWLHGTKIPFNPATALLCPAVKNIMTVVDWKLNEKFQYPFLLWKICLKRKL